MNEVFKKISEIGIVPVIAISDEEKAVPLAEALLAGGVGCVEITFRTAEAKSCIERITDKVPQMLVGAGTILSTEQAGQAINAGAKFLVSPGFNPRVVKYCIEKNFPIAPGCSTPTDMEAAIELGLKAVKFFPAEQAGGLPYIKAVAAPYSGLHFMPTGGINPENLGKYLAFNRILACGGSWMATKELINESRFDEITRLCREAKQIIKTSRTLKYEY